MATSFVDSQTPAYVNEHGFSSSVMDYLAVNLISKKTKAQLVKDHFGGSDPGQVVPFTPVIGAYDKWAIEYGYTKVDGEACCQRDPKLVEIADRYQMSSPRSFSFATDEEADDFDPTTRLFDLTSDPLKWHEEQLIMVREAMDNIQERGISSQEPWTKFFDAINRCFKTAMSAAVGIASFIGGMTINHEHAMKGCFGRGCTDPWDGPPVPGFASEPPLRPIPIPVQQRATTVLTTFLDDNSSNALFEVLRLQQQSVRRVDFYGTAPIDLHKMLTNVKKVTLQNALDPWRLQSMRLAESLEHTRTELEDERFSFSVADVLRELSDAFLGMPRMSIRQEIDEEQVARVHPDEAQMVFGKVNASTSDPTQHDFQLFYCEWLAESRMIQMKGERGMLPPDQSVASSMAAEIDRIQVVLSGIKQENLRRNGRTAEADQQLGFITNALEVMSMR